jgi:hypothetical protein
MIYGLYQRNFFWAIMMLSPNLERWPAQRCSLTKRNLATACEHLANCQGIKGIIITKIKKRNHMFCILG